MKHTKTGKYNFNDLVLRPFLGVSLEAKNSIYKAEIKSRLQYYGLSAYGEIYVEFLRFTEKLENI